ncbi:MAG: methylenetetrahydrofolate reductase [Actinomycetota bacterium]|nr:methylenetetrahydrofolate reductase [Actinomycetota bacterium]
MGDNLLTAFLARADFEIIPLKGALEKALVIPHGSTVSVTASPSRGMGTTVDLALELQERGYRAVPHLSARMIEDRQELALIIKRLDDGGVARAFITGGDGQPHGDYSDAYTLLRDMADLGHPFLEVGITGYPEGHPSIPVDRLRQAMLDKQAHATHIVTQMCFNPRAIVDWVRTTRADGVDLPVKVGVPGAIDPTRLLTIAARIGVGDSVSFLAKNHRAVMRLLRPGRFRPDRLVKPLSRVSQELGLSGLHLFTFNQVEPTVTWLRKTIARNA